jgi:hypothetical protein
MSPLSSSIAVGEVGLMEKNKAMAFSTLAKMNMLRKLESYGRVHGAIGVASTDLKQRNLFAISSDRPLILADLTGNGLVKLGADARLTSGSYLISRTWAKAIWEQEMQVDGLRYRSRHDDDR